MATDDRVFCTSDDASVALLRGLRAGTDSHSFIHRADVCSGAPEELVAGLQPAPGTDLAEDGYNSVWYIYSPKRYKNERGEPSGHRLRAVSGGGGAFWKQEGRPKPVRGLPGATSCNLSYGRNNGEGEPGRKFNRMGWTMMEYDDTQGGGGGDHVLCKVYRSTSSLAKMQFKSSTSSSSSSSSSKSASSKRKAAGGGDHPEARPAKMIHDEQVHVQVQQDPIFTNDYLEPSYVDPDPVMAGGQRHHGVQQPRVESEHGGKFSIDELLNIEEFDIDNCDWKSVLAMLGDEGEQGLLQQPSAEPEHGGEFAVSAGPVFLC